MAGSRIRKVRSGAGRTTQPRGEGAGSANSAPSVQNHETPEIRRNEDRSEGEVFLGFFWVGCLAVWFRGIERDSCFFRKFVVR